MVYFVLPFLFAVFTGSEHSHIEPIVLTHGGVDNVNELRVIQRAEGVKKAAAAGYKLLKRGGTVIDAVEAAVRVLEDDININAGSGSVLNVEGEMEMDACVMVGFNLTSGSVAGVKYIAHPVSLARLVMEKTSFFGLAGEGAHRFAKDQGVPLVKQQLLMAPHVKKDLADYLKNVSKITTCGSAGAVALDEHGHVAAATSSGGMIGKLPGRVSDSSIVGAGLYASDEIGATVVTVKIMEYLSFDVIFVLITLASGRQPIFLVHGGTDSTNQSRVNRRVDGVKAAAIQGYRILRTGGSVVDALEAGLAIMEDDGTFNTGYGSVLNIEGEIELSASIMLGSNLSSGAVTALKNVQHPIRVARLVMEKSPHFLLQGEGARRFARNQGVPLVPDSTLISPQAREDLDQYRKSGDSVKSHLQMTTIGCGDVGAIAMDAEGHLAVAASSGGRIAMMPGRMSASSLIGAGIYAHDSWGAAVVTGHGEAIARYVMASEIINLMKRGFEAGVATRNVVKGITERFRKPTGAISLSKNGQIGISFTTDKMAWAYQLRDEVHYGVDDYDHFSERIKV